MKALKHPYPFDPSYGYSLEDLLAVGAPEAPVDHEAFWQARYRKALAIDPGLVMVATYLFEHATVPALRTGLAKWFGRYNEWRPHETLGNLTLLLLPVSIAASCHAATVIDVSPVLPVAGGSRPFPPCGFTSSSADW